MSAIASSPIKQQVDVADTRSQQNSNDLITDQWISATWEEFMQVLDNPLYAESRCYYDQYQVRQMRIETIKQEFKAVSQISLTTLAMLHL